MTRKPPKYNIYSQQSGFRQGANERVEGVYMQYMSDGEQVCNTAENSSAKSIYELNMDGLVGPTHHYAGLAHGNIASTNNALREANPQAAALQGIEKMRLLHGLGLKQAVLPPHERPNLRLLYQLGFTGNPAEQIRQAHQEAPGLLSASYSASSMWAANMGTITSSVDALDGKVHFTAANLIGNLHRHQEALFSKTLFEKIFKSNDYFTHHPILPCAVTTGDEGAANHNRLCQNHRSPGLHLFVYGKESAQTDKQGPHHYPARQTLEASKAIARAHQLPNKQVIYARQNPLAIDAGVFHNDVIAVANESVLLVHEFAWTNQNDIIAQIHQRSDFPVQVIQVKNSEISLQDAVNSYLFNSQLITLPSGPMILIAPSECQSTPAVRQWLEQLINDNNNPISAIHYVDLKQSMLNGGGPACLRLRVPLTATELAATHQGIMIDDHLLDQLTHWVKKHYRTSLRADDLADPALIDESHTALDALTQILQLGSIYPFQTAH